MSDQFYQDNEAALWAHRYSEGSLSSLAAPGQHEAGAKLDGEKPDASLLLDFSRALEQVALVGTYGRIKYTRGGWLSVPDGIIRYTAALIRHLFKLNTEGKFDQDPYYDTPEGAQFKNRIRHRAQVAWNALAALELELRAEEEK